MDEGVRAGTIEDLEREGRLLTKVGALPVVVLWHEGRPWAIEDRCPHMGFPLHQGTVEAGLLTCHWHHARFDLDSGCTLDPWADDATAFDVTLHEGEGPVVEIEVRQHVGHRREHGEPRAPTLGAIGGAVLEGRRHHAGTRRVEVEQTQRRLGRDERDAVLEAVGQTAP